MLFCCLLLFGGEDTSLIFLFPFPHLVEGFGLLEPPRLVASVKFPVRRNVLYPQILEKEFPDVLVGTFQRINLFVYFDDY